MLGNHTLQPATVEGLCGRLALTLGAILSGCSFRQLTERSLFCMPNSVIFEKESNSLGSQGL